MSFNEDRFIQELLHNARVSGSHPLEQRLADTAIWFNENKDRIPRDNLASRQAFLERGFWCMLEINALLVERIRNERANKMLWIPSGIGVEGSLKKYG